MSETPLNRYEPPPRLGQRTDELLSDVLGAGHLRGRGAVVRQDHRARLNRNRCATRAAVDVLVVGGGNAALCAAIAARRASASVLVVEAAPKFYRGGNTRHTRNIRCAHVTATEHLTGPYTEDEFWDDLLRVTQGNTDEQLARHMIARSKPILSWLGEQGVHFQPSLGGTLSLGRTNSFFLGGGRAMLNALYLTAERHWASMFSTSRPSSSSISITRCSTPRHCALLKAIRSFTLALWWLQPAASRPTSSG